MSTIVTLNDFKNYIGTEEINVERAQQVIDGINAWIEAYTGRIWGEVRTITDSLDFEPVVFLSHIDVTEVTSVKLFGKTLDESEYKIDLNTGRVLLCENAERKYSRKYYNQVEVVYKSGNANVPQDLKDAGLQLVAGNYNRRDDKDANVMSESLGSYSVSYGNGSADSSSGSSAGGNATNSVMNVLNYYRVGRI